MLKKTLLSAAVGLAFAGGAQAADIVEPTAFDWTGPYIGIQGGYAWGENDAEADLALVAAAAARSSEPIILSPLDDGSIAIEGWLGGVHLGYLWQHDSFVFGVEGDGEFADIDGDTDILVDEDDDGEPIGTFDQEIEWLASLRLRAGFALDRALIYATGGVAVGGVELTLEDFGDETSFRDDSTEWGWTIGGGLEYAFTDELSARVEYRYTDLGKSEITGTEGSEYSVDNDFHAVRVGLSWHFGAM